MQLTRRDLIKLGAVAGGAAVMARVNPASAFFGGGGGGLPAPAPFTQALTLPPVLTPVRSDSLADYYEITARRTTAQIVPGSTTPVSAYNGSYPGPTLQVRKGRTAVVKHINALAEPTSVHTHGAYVDGDSDGHPSDPIAPGASRSYVFGNNQNARTMWYHDHVEHQTATNVYAGLAGFYLLRDDVEDALPLPRGEFDVPLSIQDRLFNSDGTLNYPADAVSDDGLMGNVIVVNGKAQPYFQVAARKYRFRILNGSNARPYQLSLSNGQPFQLIGTEGGLIGAPVTLTTLPIWPAERYEIVIDFATIPVGTSVVLNNTLGSGSTAEVMRFDVVRTAVDDSTVPAVLRADQSDATHIATTEAAATVTRSWKFGKTWDNVYVINDKVYDKARFDALPRPGDTEVWVFQNGFGWSHPVHVHLTNFMILDRDGGRSALPSHERGLWKETVVLHPGETVRVLMRWPAVPPPPQVTTPPPPGAFTNRYVFHCHNLGHEDHDMMAQFKVS